MSPHQTSTTTSQHTTNYQHTVTEHHIQFQDIKIRISAHLCITIRWSGAAAPWAADAAKRPVLLSILKPALILAGRSPC